MPELTVQEMDAARARLARTDVVSLRHAENQEEYNAILDRAFLRVIDKHIPEATQSFSNLGAAMDTFVKMLELLDGSRLTISFKAGNWFYDENKYSSYTNYFERGTTGASTDLDKRNNVEVEFARYTAVAGRAAPANVAAAMARIKKYGDRTSLDFRGAMRPRYAAVDFAHCREGGASKYGKSYLVLKEHMKHNATYVHKDSFEVNPDLIARKAEYEGKVLTPEDVTATYHEMGKLLLYCDPDMLRTIYRYASGQIEVGTANNIMGGLNYIEAHVHADILFKRDVKEVVISTAEMQGGVIPHPRFHRSFPFKKSTWDQSDAKRVRENAEKFAKVNGINVRFI